MHRAPAGIKETERLFRKRLDDIAGKQAAALTRAEAFKLLEDQSGTPVSTGQLRGELAAAWDYALDAGRLPESSPTGGDSLCGAGYGARGKSSRASILE